MKSKLTTKVPDGEVLIVDDTNLLGDAGSTGSLRHVAARLSVADAVIGQMEGMVVAGAETSADPLPYKPGWRHSPPAAAAAYAAAFSAVSCASNVAYPPADCAETAALLAEVGLPFAGIGVNEAAARAPAILDLPAARIGLLSYTSVFHPGLLPAGPDRPGCAVLPAQTAYLPSRRALEMPGAPPDIRTWPDAVALDTLRADIAELRPRVDLLLVSCHWGLSGATVPVAYQTELAKAAAESGADLIFGHHPHVIQGAARISGMPVFFSLGNFAFDNPRMVGRHLDGLMVRLSLRDRRIAAITVLPVQRDVQNAVRLLGPDTPDGRAILDTFIRRSRALGQPLVPDAEGVALA
jgi:poly-gamma-glutamate synthesis protein (capsule biosynthesis protein)